MPSGAVNQIKQLSFEVRIFAVSIFVVLDRFRDKSLMKPRPEILDKAFGAIIGLMAYCGLALFMVRKKQWSKSMSIIDDAVPDRDPTSSPEILKFPGKSTDE